MIMNEFHTVNHVRMSQSRTQPAALYQRPLPRNQHQPSAAPNLVADVAGLFGGNGGDATDPFTLYGTVRCRATYTPHTQWLTNLGIVSRAYAEPV